MSTQAWKEGPLVYSLRRSGSIDAARNAGRPAAKIATIKIDQWKACGMSVEMDDGTIMRNPDFKIGEWSGKVLVYLMARKGVLCAIGGI